MTAAGGEGNVGGRGGDQAPGWEARIRGSFSRQKLMRHLGASLVRLEPGRIVIELPVRADLAQEDGTLHVGVVATVVENACGYAALSCVTEGTTVLTAEIRVNLLARAAGRRLVATGRVVRADSWVTVCEGTAEAVTASGREPVAHVLGTVMSLPSSSH